MWSSCVSFWYVSSIVFSPPAPLCALSWAGWSAFAPALAPFAFAAACAEQLHAVSRPAVARSLLPRLLRYAVLADAQPRRPLHCTADLVAAPGKHFLLLQVEQAYSSSTKRCASILCRGKFQLTWPLTAACE